jgi:hypothetical protein
VLSGRPGGAAGASGYLQQEYRMAQYRAGDKRRDERRDERRDGEER